MNDTIDFDPLPWFLGIVVCPCLLLGGLSCGRQVATRHERRQAVEAGVGRYVVDPESGTTKFEYGKEGE